MKAPYIAIIPARGGSKGLPRKNILSLCGKPLIAWTIEASIRALGSGAVFVTTDDNEIARIATQYGAKVIARPAELASDQASSESAIMHALSCIADESQHCPETCVFLQCTSPLTTAEHIQQLLSTKEEQQADCALSVVRSHRFLWKTTEQTGAAGINHDSRIRLRRQDMESEFAENGAIYAFNTRKFLEHRHRFFGKIALYEMPEASSWEIDSSTDFKVAEVLLRERLQMDRKSLIPRRPSAVVFDFDGVMTDNRVITSQDGTESVTCDRSDGLGIAALRDTGIPVLVLSTEENPVVMARCKKLRIPCIHGQEDKASTLQAWAQEQGIDLSKTIYLGNDRNDSKCLELVGSPVAVADAYPEALQRALIVLENKGGDGAVRELCDLIMARLSHRKFV